MRPTIAQLEALVQSGLCDREIGERYGMTRNAISKVRGNAGIPANPIWTDARRKRQAEIAREKGEEGYICESAKVQQIAAGAWQQALGAQRFEDSDRAAPPMAFAIPRSRPPTLSANSSMAWSA